MKLISALSVLYFVTVRCHIPNVYESCSYILANQQTDTPACDVSRCQGRPGKRGVPGLQGLLGPKGEKGETGSSDFLEKRVEILEGYLRITEINVDKQVEFCGMGIKNGDIPDEAITGSSTWRNDPRHEPRDGRLDNVRSEASVGAWAPNALQVGEWIQVDFGKPKQVSGVVTQGRQRDYNQWVTSYKLACGNNTSSLHIIREDDAEKVFQANRDQNTKVVHKLPEVMNCRYVRIYPQTWNGFINLRFELLKGECFQYY